MKKVQSRINKILFILLAASTANAYATNGVFMMVEGGAAKQYGLPAASNIGANTSSTKLTPPSWRLAIGYNHDFIPCFGLGMEVASGHYGNEVYSYLSGGSTRFRSRTMEFLADFQFHYHHWDWIAKVGALRKTALIDGKNAPRNQTQIRAQYGLDGLYNFTPHIAVMASYAHLCGEPITNFSHLKNKTPSLNAFLLGVRYTFF